MKIAIIKWIDSTMHGTEEFDKDDNELKPMEGFSCGLLVRDTDDSITIALDYWKRTERFRNCETIYKKQIETFEIFEVKDIFK